MKDEASEWRGGSIMMETVLAIPLFMILLGGTFWIGELMIARQKLVICDRYIAWNKGLRYDDRGQIDSATVRRLFFTEPDGTVLQNHRVTSARGTIADSFDWSHAAEGQARLDVEMPDWTRFMFNAGRMMYSTGEPDPRAMNIQGRDKPDQKHVVVMRTKAEAEMSYIRNKYGVSESGEVASQWRDITDEKWPYE
jgi:hypothetical protein